MRITLLIFYLLTFYDVSSLRILAIFPHSGKSHFSIVKPLLLCLADYGHQVTVISHFPMEEPRENYKDFSLKGLKPTTKSSFNLEDFNYPYFWGNLARNLKIIKELQEMASNNCLAMLENHDVHYIEKDQYDIILLEQFNSDCGLALVHALQLPFIGVITHLPMPYMVDRLRIINNPAYVQHSNLGYGSKPSLWETICSLFLTCYMKIIYHNQQLKEYEILKRYYDGLPFLEDIAKNTSLTFVTTYFPMHGAIPYPMNYIEIGGVHIHHSEERITFNEELEYFLRKGYPGTVVFSMGSMLNGASWPEEKYLIFRRVFSKFRHQFLWKWENDTMPDKPRNVKIMKWFPQYDVLRHPNIKGLITHGGLASLTEAAYAGVPTIVIPIFGDQFSNAAAVEEAGTGVRLDYNNISEYSLSWALNSILNSNMQIKVHKVSEVWKNRIKSPTETAIYWIEHVAKYGTSYIRSPLSDISFVRLYLIDVFCIIGLVIFVFTFIILRLVYSLVICISNHKKKYD